MDYCNSALVGITGHQNQMKRLQSIQNAAARLIVGASKYDAITPTLRDPHWLPVRQRIDFKMGVLAYKCQHDMAPPYLTAMFVSTTMPATAFIVDEHAAAPAHADPLW